MGTGRPATSVLITTGTLRRARSSTGSTPRGGCRRSASSSARDCGPLRPNDGPRHWRPRPVRTAPHGHRVDRDGHPAPCGTRSQTTGTHHSRPVPQGRPSEHHRDLAGTQAARRDHPCRPRHLVGPSGPWNTGSERLGLTATALGDEGCRRRRVHRDHPLPSQGSRETGPVPFSGDRRGIDPRPDMAHIGAVPEHYRVALMVCVWCGPRSSEARGLRRRDIQLRKRVIHVEQAVSRVKLRPGRWDFTSASTSTVRKS